ncbi:restriction endonuclease subunit S [Sorangium sp. KYC3313]|uniref:restriction endonuclease subunit S n=1 Tax=Sorangium sp. KYC3313 TaxID=3449740 RepID=UPI003F8ABB31
MNEIKVPLPPVDEQRRIVSWLGAISGRVTEARDILARRHRDIIDVAKSMLFPYGSTDRRVAFGRLLDRRTLNVRVESDVEYQFAGVYSFGRGMFVAGRKAGRDFAYKELARVRAGQFCYPKLMAWEGAFAVVPSECDGMHVSPEFPVFDINQDLVIPEVIEAYFKMPDVWSKLAGDSIGTNLRRRRLNPSDLLAAEMPLPSMDRQLQYRQVARQLKAADLAMQVMESDLDVLLPAALVQLFCSEKPLADGRLPSSAVGRIPEFAASDRSRPSLVDDSDEEISDALICCVVADELQKAGKRCRRFHLSKFAYIAKRIGGIPIYAEFIRHVAGPWSPRINDVAQHTAVHRGWLAMKGERGDELIPGPRFAEALAMAQQKHGVHLGKLNAILSKLHTFGDSGLERWATILKVVEDLQGANRSVTEEAIQAEIDGWPGKREKDAFGRDSVQKAIRGMVHEHWLPPIAAQ